MFELIGALIGGVFRLAPEVLKILDRKFEREHELKKLDVEVSIAKMQAEFALQLVRPAVTYWFVFFYTAVKVAGLYLAFLQDGIWTNVLITGWTDFDEGMLAMILSFYFIGRVWESSKK